jgi:pimeloyl-ACP methyl ester carboxylesterase
VSRTHQGAKALHGAPVVVGPGRLVSIGGGRSLYLRCVGSGSPTVVLEAGFGGDSNNWSVVQPRLGHITRTCAYDRAGLGNSLPLPGVHDGADELADLQRLLSRAKLPPPYVVVGHSYGGLLARMFAVAHPATARGVVLVDAMGQDQDRRAIALWRAQPPSVRRAAGAPVLPPVQSGVAVRATERLAARVRTLGHRPLVVITRGRLGDTLPPMPRRVRLAFGRLWTTMQGELAGMSTDHVHVVAVRSGHFVQGPVGGQPSVVVAGVRAVVDAVRSGRPLPSCARVFRGPAVRCG